MNHEANANNAATRTDEKQWNQFIQTDERIRRELDHLSQNISDLKDLADHIEKDDSKRRRCILV